MWGRVRGLMLKFVSLGNVNISTSMNNNDKYTELELLGITPDRE
jgi:hypothetical protein